MAGFDFLIQGVDSTQSMLTDVIATHYQREAARKAAKNQLAAADEAGDITTQYGDQALGYYEPYYNQGVAQWDRLNSMLDSGAFDMPDYNANAPEYGQYTAPEFKFETEPGYEFRKQQGQQAIEGAAAARGSLLSGATQKALARYGQNLASEEYGKAYERYSNERQQGFNEYTNMRNFLFNKYNTGYDAQNAQLGNQYNRLASAASTGFNAGTNMSNVTGNMGDTLSSLALRRGDIRAHKDTVYGDLAAARWRNQGQINSNFIQQDILGGNRTSNAGNANYDSPQGSGGRTSLSGGGGGGGGGMNMGSIMGMFGQGGGGGMGGQDIGANGGDAASFSDVG